MQFGLRFKMLIDIPAHAAGASGGGYDERVAIILGFLTLLFMLIVLVSCRSFMSLLSRLHLEKFLGSKAYQSFYRYHATYWWLFGVLLLAHIMIAVMHTGLPQAGDPDASIHWAILLLGLGGAMTAVTILASCRIVPRLLAPVTPSKPFSNAAFRAFFGYHAYYWGLAILLVAVHFVLGYIHASVWPAVG